MYRSSRPGTSPSSYPGEPSFLQRALGQEEDAAKGTPALYRQASMTMSRRLTPPLESEDDGLSSEETVHAPELPRDIAPVRRRDEATVRRVSAESEQTPLLRGTAATSFGTLAPPPPGAPVPRRRLSLFRQSALADEARTLLRYMTPIIGTHLLEYSLLVVTVISVGHLGTIELAAASIASMTANVAALSLIQGFCTALDTLCPQAYTSERKNTGLYALRTGVLVSLLLIPEAFIFWHSEHILLFLKQDPAVARLACHYLRVLTLGLPGYAGFECSRRWLQAQGLMVAPVITLAVAAPLNLCMTYLFVYGPKPIGIGFLGAPLSTAISMDAMFLTSVCYAYFFAPRDAWGGLTWDMFKELHVNFKLGLAGTAMVSSEWWCWEIAGLAASYLGPVSLAAQAVLITSASLFYQVPYALAVAAAVRIGNLMGSNDPRRAKVASHATLSLAIAIALVNSLVLIVLRDYWGSLFSSEKDVIKLVAQVLPLVALFQVADGVSGATGGIVRGAGKSTLGALVNLAAYYVIGLPVGFCLTFIGPRLGLFGLWIGLTVALSWTGILMTWCIFRIDWQKECELTKIRMGVVPEASASSGDV